jgi:hypothetical protein
MSEGVQDSFVWLFVNVLPLLSAYGMLLLGYLVLRFIVKRTLLRALKRAARLRLGITTTWPWSEGHRPCLRQLIGWCQGSLCSSVRRSSWKVLDSMCRPSWQG